MADEKTPVGTEPASTEAAPSWDFEAAGFDPKTTDPSTIAEALEFRSQWEGRQPLDETAVEAKARELQSQWFSDPRNYAAVEKFFEQKFQKNQQVALKDDTEITPQVLRQLYEQTMREVREEIARVQQGFQGLSQQQQAAAEAKKLASWQQDFEKRADEAVSRASNGLVDPQWLKGQLVKSFIAGEIKSDSPAALRAAAAQLAKGEAARMQRVLDQLGVTQMLGRRQLSMSPETKISDVVKDKDKVNELVTAMMSHGLDLED